MFFNNVKTAVLLACMSALLLFMGNLFGGSAGLNIALIIALVMNLISYFYSDRIVLKMYGATPLDPKEYDWIYKIIEELRTKMNIPMPKLWLVQTPMANAFATGRNPQHASVAVTTGILQILNKEELRGVLAHELSHVQNRDILVSTVAATLATAIGYLANILQHMALWGSFSNNSNDQKRGNPIIMAIVALLMPIAATLIQLAISRSREYLADETGAHTCHDPLALASALQKLQNHIPEAHLKNDDAARAGTAPLFIVHPFTANSWIALFSTHPPMNERIARLKAMNEKMF
jgi:heat shock protein HtpX